MIFFHIEKLIKISCLKYRCWFLLSSLLTEQQQKLNERNERNKNPIWFIYKSLSSLFSYDDENLIDLGNDGNEWIWVEDVKIITWNYLRLSVTLIDLIEIDQLWYKNSKNVTTTTTTIEKSTGLTWERLTGKNIHNEIDNSPTDSDDDFR